MVLAASRVAELELKAIVGETTMIIRLPNNLKHKVELMAEEQGVSLNQFALYAFTKEVIQSETQSLASKLDEMKKQQEKNRFAHLAKKVESFKTGKSMLKVTTTSLRTWETSIHYESYQQMRARHQKKGCRFFQRPR